MRTARPSIIAILFVTGTVWAQTAPPPGPPPPPPPGAPVPPGAETPPPPSGPAPTEAAAGSQVPGAPAPPATTPTAPAGVAVAPPPATATAPAVDQTPAAKPAAAAPDGGGQVVPAPGGPPAPFAPPVIKTPSASLKLGLLVQPQYETVGSPTRNRMSQNLFLRRTRILIGGTLFSDFEFFLDTDFPDLFKANADTGIKNTPGMNIQDVFVTYRPYDALKFDVGYMLPPLGHNAVQGAGTLYGWDYFANTFRHSNAFASSANPVGRDAGIQLRGLLIGKGLVEYRVGMFQGIRYPADANRAVSRNFFRVAGRLQINLLDPEPGFFYAGSYLGTKNILSFGASFDAQGTYTHWSFDGLLDVPLGPGVVTAQVNVAYWNGRHSVPLPAQTAFMAEGGYLFDAIRLSPIVRYEQRWMDNATTAAPDEKRWGGGFAVWPYGHNFNLKAFYTRVEPEPAVHSFDQLNVQAQLMVY